MTQLETVSPLLEACELDCMFGSGHGAVRAVQHASFAVERGEVVAIVGESGSGKTTLARMLLGLLEPSYGHIFLDGRDVTRLRGFGQHHAYWQRVQAVFQDPFASFNQFYRVGRVMENAAGLLAESLSGLERSGRIATALECVGLDAGEVLQRWPHELSGGQRQRVMIARALLIEPQLLIADEPTSMLDASMRANVLNLLRNCAVTKSMAIVFITHDIGQAAYLSDRMLVMYRGEIVEQGVPEQVLWAPQHPYTARLMADVPRLVTSRIDTPAAQVPAAPVPQA
jgi:peptide/nickel transport system ATP-binding protein